MTEPACCVIEASGVASWDEEVDGGHLWAGRRATGSEGSRGRRLGDQRIFFQIMSVSTSSSSKVSGSRWSTWPSRPR